VRYITISNCGDLDISTRTLSNRRSPQFEAIVEIEQARIDRENQIELRESEQAEKKRSDRLERKIGAIGVGLAAGGIAASSGTDQTL
jgi:hypothetical protein